MRPSQSSGQGAALSLTVVGRRFISGSHELTVDGGAPLAGGIVGVGGEIQWPRPARPGDVLHVESEVVSVTPSRSKPDRGLVEMRSETKNQKGEVVQVLLAKLIVPRKADPVQPAR